MSQAEKAFKRGEERTVKFLRLPIFSLFFSLLPNCFGCFSLLPDFLPFSLISLLKRLILFATSPRCFVSIWLKRRRTYETRLACQYIVFFPYYPSVLVTWTWSFDFYNICFHRPAADLVKLQPLKCRLLSLSWIKMSAVIGDPASKISSPITINISFPLLLLWKTVQVFLWASRYLIAIKLKKKRKKRMISVTKSKQAWVRPGSHLRHNDITGRSRKPKITSCWMFYVSSVNITS